MANDRHPVLVTIFDRSGRKKITAYDDSMWGWPNEESVTDYVMSYPAKKYPDHVIEVMAYSEKSRGDLPLTAGSLTWRFRTGRLAGQTTVRLLRKSRSASRPKPSLHHATKATPKSQRAMYDEASRKNAEINETFLEMLPTMRRRELEQLIKKRPALWGRFAAYLTSGHRFVDDPPAHAAHATKKKSPAQLQREIDEALAKPMTASKETSVLPPKVSVARAGLESVHKYGIKNLRYGLYRHAGDRMYQWGNFTGTPEHVITAVVPNAKNTASQDALIRALKWKR